MIEEAKKKVDKDLIEVSAKLDKLSRNTSNLERTRTRLSTEIEDLKLEIEREHNVTRNAERLLKQVEAQNQANLEMEDERRQKEVAESTARMLKATIYNQLLSIDEKSNQIASLQKSKVDLDYELETKSRLKATIESREKLGTLQEQNQSAFLIKKCSFCIFVQTKY